MFYKCETITTVPLYDTSNVTDFQFFMGDCHALTALPYFDMSSAINVESAFYETNHVQSGALALYNQLSTLPTVPTYSIYTFYHSGYNTETGYAELQQIPRAWGGLAS